MYKKLIELLSKCPCGKEVEIKEFGSCSDRKYGMCGEVDRLSYCVLQHLADHLIANGVTVQEWISVKDRLPEKGTGNVLVVKQFRGKPYVDMGEVIGETACCYSDEYSINPREHIFTHWMPLPQPPKGE